MKVYILKCDDGSYYTGVTADLRQRIEDHSKRKGAKYTKLKRPVALVYSEDLKNKTEAEKRELHIKKLSKINKERLIKYGKGIKTFIDLNKNEIDPSLVLSISQEDSGQGPNLSK